jgi:CheY-like chemotaxis protein
MTTKKPSTTISRTTTGVTGYPTKENVARILAEGAEACLPKPVSRSTLISILDQHTSVATNRPNVA